MTDCTEQTSRTASTPSAAGARRQARRGGHPLLRPFPLVVMTLSTFLVVFTLMMARLTAGADPALRASVSPAAISQPIGSGGTTVTTRASGAAVATPAVATEAGPQGTPTTSAIVTRTSGAGGVSGAGDD
jgi:hypothetical protein